MDLGGKKRIRNFVLTKKKQGKVTFIIVSTLSGEWSMSFRADNKMFRLLDSVEKEMENSVYTWITTLYAASHVVDGDFTNGMMSLLDKYFEGLKSEEKRLGDEEDNEVLEEERRAHEMKEELDKLEDNEG
nr:MAG TPA: hypothetical protein [Caudoviricetes sp.]